jgi:TRAP-type uncharacterized transport system substrate-binding protein
MKKLLVIVSLTVGLTGFAQESTFLVADGSSSGTYQLFLKEIVVATPDSGITFKEVPSSGAVENLDKLINNEVMGAFVHSDVLFHRSKAESGLDTKYKTLLALFNEDVHFVALSTAKRTTGGTFGYGAKPVVFKDITDLSNGGRVGAAGGGFITANVIKLLGDISYSIVKFDSGKDVLQALNDGTIDAAVFVGAAPLPNLKDLGANYKLLPIPGNTADKLKLVYKPAVVTYTKMNPNGVPTVSAQCLFVAKVYKSQKMVNTIGAFRKSFFDHLDDIKETPGNHKKWNDVTPEEHGTWPWLELPVANTAAK